LDLFLKIAVSYFFSFSYIWAFVIHLSC